MKHAVVIATLLSGCNALLGIGDPTHADADSSSPSCETGWSYRVPITIENTSDHELTDYAVMLTVDTASLVAEGKLQPTGDDLRVTGESGNGPFALLLESGVETATTAIWVEVPAIPVGPSTIVLYYGNAGAAARAESPFVQGVIANPSFEASGAWTIEAHGKPATAWLIDRGWHSEGSASLFIDEEVNGFRADTSYTQLTQPVTFPPASDYRIRFDLDIVAASNGPSDAATFYLSSGNGLDFLWQLGARHNITGLYLDQETLPFGPGTVPLALGVSVDPGSDHAYAKGYFDNVRLRKYVSPEPTARMGAEESACLPRS